MGQPLNPGSDAAQENSLEALQQRLAQVTAERDRAYRELDDLARYLSHDLRAPLRGVDSYSQALLLDYEACVDEVGKAYLGFIRDSSRAAFTVLERLLIYLRLLHSPQTPQAVDLVSLAQMALESTPGALAHPHVRVTMPAQLPARGDPAMLTRLLIELLDNAYKFSAGCTVPNIVLDLAPESAAQGVLTYRLSDNGAGLNMAYVQKLFQPFERLHGQHEFEGLGLGLAICRRIIERHAGRIWITGAVGEGASIYFTLPPEPSNP